LSIDAITLIYRLNLFISVRLIAVKPDLQKHIFRTRVIDVLGRAKTILAATSPNQGCQMVYFETKNPNLDIFWRALEWKMFEYFMTT
jgi:hypothetical protein